MNRENIKANIKLKSSSDLNPTEKMGTVFRSQVHQIFLFKRAVKYPTRDLPEAY